MANTKNPKAIHRKQRITDIVGKGGERGLGWGRKRDKRGNGKIKEGMQRKWVGVIEGKRKWRLRKDREIENGYK